MPRTTLGSGDKVRRKRDGRVGFLTRFVGQKYKPGRYHFKLDSGGHASDEYSRRDFELIESNPFRHLGKKKTRRRKKRT